MLGSLDFNYAPNIGWDVDEFNTMIAKLPGCTYRYYGNAVWANGG